MELHPMQTKIKNVSIGIREMFTIVALVSATVSAQAIDKSPMTTPDTQLQIEVVGKKFTASDCALWRGDSNHVNDVLPASYSEHVIAVHDVLKNQNINETLQSISLYCNSKSIPQ